MNLNLNLIRKKTKNKKQKIERKKKNLIIHMREERAKVIDEGRERETNWGR